MIRRIGLLWAVIAALVLAMPNSASAITYEWNVASSGSVPSYLPCIENTYAKACFDHNGDFLWVKDKYGDGESAVADWYYCYATADGCETNRRGGCRNALSAGSWGYCNKELAETGHVRFRACRIDWDGERVRHNCTSYIDCYTNGAGCRNLSVASDVARDPAELNGDR